MLIVIILLGFFLRFINIGNNPPALYGDELTIVLDSSSLLTTGTDQLGNSFPLTFEMGAGRPAGYVYLSIPFVAIFGPTALGVRMLSVLSGVGIVFLLYLIGKKIFSEKLGLLAAFLTAITPWGINLSRGGFEANLALFLSLLGIYLLMLAREKSFHYIFSAFCFGLVIHTYPTFKISLPLIMPFIIRYLKLFEHLKSIKDRFRFGLAILIIFLFGLLAIFQTFFAASELRFLKINIFSQEQLKAQIEQRVNLERHLNNLPDNLAAFFHNKGTEYTKVLIENYLQNFSLDFLVIHGDGNPRHNMATMGQIFLAEFILFFIGLITFWTKEKKVLIMLFGWLLLAPIATALVDIPHALRSSFMLPPIIIISSLGLIFVLDQKNRALLISILFILIIQFIFFTQKLYFLSPNEYTKFWSAAAKEASEIAAIEKNNFNFVILSDRIDNIEFAYPVYSKVEVREIIAQNKTKVLLNNREFKKFDNVYIGYLPDEESEQFMENIDGSVLFISDDQADSLAISKKLE